MGVHRDKIHSRVNIEKLAPPSRDFDIFLQISLNSFDQIVRLRVGIFSARSKKLANLGRIIVDVIVEL